MGSEQGKFILPWQVVLVASCDHLEKTYLAGNWKVPAVRGVSLSVSKGELIALVGPSGCGKTTLLNLLSGLDVPDRGTVSIVGRTINGLTEDERSDVRLRNVGMVFQENNLIGQLTAGENVELILRFQGVGSPARIASELLGLVGIEDLYDRYPKQMSGGQRQRVGIARALAGERALLLCDEPTGALDSVASVSLFSLLRNLAKDGNRAVVVATHDPIALEHADRTCRMRDGSLTE